MLTSVSAKDLFLAYHQDSMAKRLLDCLNQPKLEPELLLLRLLAENLGNIMLNSHFSMIKDIQNSIDITENISKILPFINYKWDLKVINSSVWPDSTLKIRFSHMYTFYYLALHHRFSSNICINFKICINNIEVLLYNGNQIEAHHYFKVVFLKENGDFKLKTFIWLFCFILMTSKKDQ